MSQERIKLKIDHLGRPTIEAIGFTGTSCAAATSGIEKALAGAGEGERSVVLKPEFYEVAPGETEKEFESGY
jgi:hypothetical protein